MRQVVVLSLGAEPMLVYEDEVALIETEATLRGDVVLRRDRAGIYRLKSQEEPEPFVPEAI